MPRHYTRPNKASRDARHERRLMDAEAARAAGLVCPVRDPRDDDAREPWRIDIDFPGHEVHWIVTKERRNVRQWVVRDANTGEFVMRAGADAIGLAAFAKLPRNYLGKRHLTC